MSTLEAALGYAAKGWEIFPAYIARDGRKLSHKPRKFSNGRNWGKTRDADDIRADWARWPDALVGVCTGIDSGIWVVETDTKKGGHGFDGADALAALIAEHGPLPFTLQAESPSGSRHYYFAWPFEYPITNSTSSHRSRH